MSDIATIYSASIAPPSSATGLLESVANFPSKLAGHASAPELNLNELLSDLTLPPQALDIVQPILGKMFFRFDTKNLRDQSTALHKITVATRPDMIITFVHLPARALVLTDTLFRVSDLGYTLSDDAAPSRTVRVLSVGADEKRLSLNYKTIWANWKRLRIDAYFVPWYEFEQLAQTDEQERAEKLPLVLQIDRDQLVRSPSAEKFMPGDERAKIAAIIARRPAFLTADSRRVMLEGASLGQYAAIVDLQGPPRIVSQNLVGQLLEGGVLGGFLQSLCDEGDLPVDDKQLIMDVLARYTFR